MRSAPGSFWQKRQTSGITSRSPRGRITRPWGRRRDVRSRRSRYRARLLNPTLALEVLGARRCASSCTTSGICISLCILAGNGTDRGGNDVRVRYFGKSTNLHRVWDSSMIDEERLSYTEWVAWLAPRLDRAFRARYANIDPKDWIGEGVRAIGFTPTVIGSATAIFSGTRMRCARTRLMAAGWRIAAISMRPVKPCQRAPALKNPALSPAARVMPSSRAAPKASSVG